MTPLLFMYSFKAYFNTARLSMWALDERTLKKLKALAVHQAIPYQIPMRVFILRGIESMKQAS